MKSTFFNTLCVCILLFSNSFAQGPATTDEYKKAIVKLEGVQMRYSFDEVSKQLLKRLEAIPNFTQRESADIREEYASAKDTIRGTAVLITDGNKMYMVTAKHLIVSKEKTDGIEDINPLIIGKVNVNGQISNDINMIGLTYYFSRQPTFAFSSDKDDVAVISFASKNFKNYADYLKGIGCVPIPVQNIATDVNNGDELVAVGYPETSFQERSTGISTGKAKATDKDPASFTANVSVTPGYSGGPVFKGNKLVGIISYPDDVTSNADVSKKPYKKASSATVIKASVILSVLKDLQGKEGK
ncbi:MAG: serine protease [Mucilaginibacter sp.]